MTRKQQIRGGLGELVPSPRGHDVETVRRMVECVLDRVSRDAGMARKDRRASAQPSRRNLQRFLKTARRLKSDFQALDPAHKPYLAEVVAHPIGIQPLPLIDRLIFQATALLNKPPAKRQRPGKRGVIASDLRRVAAQWADALLLWCGHVSGPAWSAITRGGKWEEITKLLIGDEDAEVLNHLRAVKKGGARLHIALHRGTQDNSRWLFIAKSSKTPKSINSA